MASIGFKIFAMILGAIVVLIGLGTGDAGGPLIILGSAWVGISIGALLFRSVSDNPQRFKERRY